MNEDAQRIITKLGLSPLPDEGGFYRQTWAGPPCGDDRAQPVGTAIYFLITSKDFSALHRLETDEIWHFYAGDPIKLVQLNGRDQSARQDIMGSDILAGQVPQVIVRAGVWQGAELAAVNLGWALVGCTMAPGWSEQGFTLGQRETLRAAFPEEAADICRLTR